MSRPQNLCRAKRLTAESLERGKEYKVFTFIQEKSKFANKDGTFPVKLLAYYYDFGMLFYSYMPQEYDDLSAEKFNEYLQSIEKKENVRIVFYGKIGVSNELHVLKHGEEVNEEKLSGIRRIEMVQNQSKYGFEGKQDHSGNMKRSHSASFSSASSYGEDTYDHPAPKMKKSPDGSSSKGNKSEFAPKNEDSE